MSRKMFTTTDRIVPLPNKKNSYRPGKIITILLIARKNINGFIKSHSVRRRGLEAGLASELKIDAI